jgi:ATP-dependent protease Clp ATPase subunit
MPKKQRFCGFCGKSDDEAEQMLGGPCIDVCNECIDMMHKIIHETKPILPVKPAAKPQNIIPFRARKDR